MQVAILRETASVSISAASIWEIAIKSALGKLSVPDGLIEELARQGFEELVVTFEDALAAGALPPHHRDPFDRMLIAQAVNRDLLLVSADPQLRKYDVRVLQ